MGTYREVVVPRLIDWACGAASFAPWRRQVCDGLAGTVVEIGFGSGHNVPYYPDDVEVVYAIEPAALAIKLAQKRVAATLVPIEHVGLDGQALPLADASCDAALSTFTLCTVPDPARALAELRRVLRPGGRLHVLDHGLAPTPGLALAQRVLDPFEQRLAGGCHLTREPLALIRDAGFELLWTKVGPARGPRPWCYFSAGVATTTGVT